MKPSHVKNNPISADNLSSTIVVSLNGLLFLRKKNTKKKQAVQFLVCWYRQKHCKVIHFLQKVYPYLLYFRLSDLYTLKAFSNCIKVNRYVSKGNNSDMEIVVFILNGGHS